MKTHIVIECHMKKKGDLECKPRNTKGGWPSPQVRKRKGRILPRAFR